MSKILQLKIVLDGITPKIWRRFLVKDNIPFEDLHEIIQIVMGWDNYHLYEFKIENNTISSDEEGYNAAEGMFKHLFNSPEFHKMLEQQDLKKGSASMDINKLNKILDKERAKKSKPVFTIKTKLNELVASKGKKFSYLYDFGDNWDHIVTVENILDNKDAALVPVCLEGERACPPEDCGSYPGYYELMEIKKNKKHPEYKERIAGWLCEDFDFENFDIEEINKELLKLIKVDGRTRYLVPK